jgi:hypothetical protein
MGLETSSPSLACLVYSHGGLWLPRRGLSFGARMKFTYTPETLLLQGAHGKFEYHRTSEAIGPACLPARERSGIAV